MGIVLLIIGAVALLALLKSPLFAILMPLNLRCIFDILWGLPLAAICCGLALFPTLILSNPITRFLGKISYSLYLAHPNLVSALSEHGVYGWLRERSAGPGIALLFSILVTLALLIPTATFLFHVIEKPGMQLGRLLVARAKKRFVASSAL
jgi:peptidoglycan/LPS O-acetylase OafA/YrhL